MEASLTVGLVVVVFCICIPCLMCQATNHNNLVANETNTNDVNNTNFTNTTRSSTEEIGSLLSGLGLEVTEDQTGVTMSARMKMSDMFHPIMLVPQLILWGFAPILLANLKLFVVQALMMNKMALSSAIYMTLRNIVFGPRPGPLVKYSNYGYGQPTFHHYHRRS